MKATNFNKYCTDTAKLPVEEYDWYYMLIHKILIHGVKVIANMNIPIG